MSSLLTGRSYRQWSNSGFSLIDPIYIPGLTYHESYLQEIATCILRWISSEVTKPDGQVMQTLSHNFPFTIHIPVLFFFSLYQSIKTACMHAAFFFSFHGNTSGLWMVFFSSFLLCLFLFLFYSPQWILTPIPMAMANGNGMVMGGMEWDSLHCCHHTTSYCIFIIIISPFAFLF